MRTILDTIADYARIRVAKDKEKLSIEELKELCAQYGKADGEAFKKALEKPELSFICEIKKASPSKGVISADFPYMSIGAEYEAAGADCISCLTEPKWFMGSDTIFKEVRSEVAIPMLRKDFTIDEYQIYQAVLMGANAVLLICSLLDEKTLYSYLCLCSDLGIAAVTETHNEDEIKKAAAVQADIIGVNNRNLKNFSVDVENSERLRLLVPANALFVAESGIKTADDIKALKKISTDAVLIGEVLMRADDKKSMLNKLKGNI